MALSPSELKRYSRHLSLQEIGPDGQDRLRAARVLVVGVGGLGSPASLYLAAAGIGTLGVLDFDQVEESNLQRQVLFQTADIGRPKAQAAQARLSALNPHIRVLAHCLELRADNVQSALSDYDLIVDGTDRIATHYLINDACVLYGKTLVSAAVYRFEGQLMSYVPGRGPCYRCLYPQIEATAAASCAEVGVLGVLPGVLGTLQATEAIKLLTGAGEALLGRLLTYDALEMRFQQLRLTRRADCAVCGEHPSITTPLDSPQGVLGISAAELARRLALDSALQVIDVREPHEFAAGHITGSLNQPLSGIEQHGLAPPLSGEVILVCRSGVRSARAARLSVQAGHGAVRQLEGGLLRWQAEIQPSLSVLER